VPIGSCAHRGKGPATYLARLDSKIFFGRGGGIVEKKDNTRINDEVFRLRIADLFEIALSVEKTSLEWK